MLFGSLQKKRYPIRVVIIRRYANALKIDFDRGGIFPEEIKTENGVIKTEVLKLMKNKAEIPAPDISFYHDVDNERVLYLFQYERDVFFPCKVTNEKISYFVPEIIVNEKGEKIIKMKEVELFTPKLNIEEINEKTWSYWLASRIELANRMFRKVSFWERWGGMFMLAILVIVGVMIFVVAFQQYSNIIGQASQSLQNVADALNKVADKLAQVSQQNVTAPITPPSPPY
jgi:hypothetical protein